jgi:tetratricopeptide (TPR) repeat protein
MNIITNNPYRILGVYAGASLKDMNIAKKKIKAFSDVGQYLKLASDCLLLEELSPPNRDEESIRLAESNLVAPKDKIKYALFWFNKVSLTDENSLKDLEQNGDTEKIMNDVNDANKLYSSLLNWGIICLIWKNYDEAIRCFSEIIHNSNYREDFKKAIVGDAFHIDETELAKIFIQVLEEEDSATNWYELFLNAGTLRDSQFVKDKYIEKYIKSIEEKIYDIDTIKSLYISIHQ